MKRISSKPTVYLIDGSNFSRSLRSNQGGAFSDSAAARVRGDADALETEFLNWLDSVSRLGAFSASCFRVIFDGGFRPVRGLANPAINVYFSGHESADDFLLERSCFLSVEGSRCVIVSNDREIREKAAAEKVKSMACDAFYRLCGAELNKENK